MSTTRFEMVIPWSMDLLPLVSGLETKQWKPTLWALYLHAAVYIPKEAKTATGASFGLCDAEGNYRPGPVREATHFGWSLDEPAPLDCEVGAVVIAREGG